MANTASVVTKMSTNVIPFEQGMKRVQAVAKSAAASIQGDFGKASKEIGTSFGAIGVAIGAALGGAAAITGAVMLADNFHLLEQRIKTATAATGDFKQVNQALFDITQSNGVAFGSTVEIFQKLAMSAKDLGATNTQIETVVDTVQKLGVVGGTSGQQLDAALLQLSQALGSGKLQGDELKSIMENMPILARKIAQGLDVSVGSLKQMGAQGKLTSKEVFDSILQAAPEASKLFNGMSLSIEANFIRMQNSAGRFFGELDRYIPATDAVKGSFQIATDGIELARQKLKEFTDQSVELGKIHTTVGREIQAAWIGIGASIQIAWANFKDFANGQTDKFGPQVSEKIAGEAAQKIADTLKGVENAGAKMTDTVGKSVVAVDKKAISLAKRQAEAFRKFIENLQEQDRELSMHLEHRDKEIPLVKTLAAAEASVGRPLKENEQTLVRKYALQLQINQAQSDARDYVRSIEQENELLGAQLTNTEDLVKARQELSNYLNQHPNTSADDVNKIRQEISERITQTKAVKDQANQLQEYTQLYQEYKTLLDDTLTPMEQYTQMVDKLKFGLAAAIIDQEQFNKLLAAQAQKLSEANSADHFSVLKQQFDDVQQLISLTTPLTTFNAELKKLTDLKDGAVLSTQQFNTGMAQLGQNILQSTGGLTQLGTAQLTYKQNLDALDAALKAGTISQQQYNTAVNQNKQALSNSVPVIGEMASAFGNAFSSAITGAQSFSQVLDNLLQQLINIAAQTLIIKPFTSALGNIAGSLFGGGTGGILGGIGKIFGFASGGDPPTNQWSVTGEDGPEFIKPRGAVSVVPFSKMGAAGGGGATPVTNVIINNNSKANVEQSSQKNSDGGIDEIINIVEKKISDNVAQGRGSLYQSMKTTYGQTLPSVRR